MSSKASSPQDASQKKASPAQSPGHDSPRPSHAGTFWRMVAAILSGLLLSLAFPPAEQAWLAWLALLPLLLVPTPRTWLERLATGYLFGYAHFSTCLHWLNEVGFGAGWLLALWCALFPMVWYALTSALFWRLKDHRTASFPGAGPLFIPSELHLAGAGLFTALLWVTLEWCRGWLLTGFPWNQLGVSQYRHPALLAITAWTGVHGLSFIIVLVNAVLAGEASRQLRQLIAPHKRQIPWHLCLGVLAMLPLGFTAIRKPAETPQNVPLLRVAAIQGNIPQCRVWTAEQYADAMRAYNTLSRQAANETENLDLIVWPEAALPAPLDELNNRVIRLKLLKDTGIPLLIGSLQDRSTPDAPEGDTFNSAFLLNTDGTIADYYDKVHRVPFGEYTPFGDQFPWLREMIGMGRDLTPGKGFHPILLPKGACAGVNICFEDAFSLPSREFTLQGAKILFTLTNDSWYNQSSGAAQHTSHAVMRAVENRRPFLRSGNNSHTMLITPTGQMLGQLRDRKTGSDFTRDFQAYDLPIHNWGTTFYTRHGDVFAHVCALLCIITIAKVLLQPWFLLKNRQLATIDSARK